MNALFPIMTLALTTAALAAPSVTAGHACEDGVVLAQADPFTLGAYRDGCAGAFIRTPGPCHEALWGYHGEDFGVGGHDGCETTAYVGTGLVTPLLP